MVTVDHKRRKGLGPKQSLLFAALCRGTRKLVLTYNFMF